MTHDASHEPGTQQAGGPGVPAPLHERVREALGADAVEPTPEGCIAAGERMLARVLASDVHGRDTAVELLTADALVTRAFELAADEPGRLDELAAAAMVRIAAAGTSAR